MLSEAWMDQLEFQARWVAADLFPGQAVGVERWPADNAVSLTNATGTRQKALVLQEGVRFQHGEAPSGLRDISSWDEIVSYCNSLVNEG